MSRPKKCRRVCCMPGTLAFIPVDGNKENTPIALTVDEYETIRLIDKEGLSQEDCSRRMDVARTTVQQIYTNARKKLADALVEGRPLRIEGGEYRLCGEGEPFCGCSGCHRRRCSRTPINQEEEEK